MLDLLSGGSGGGLNLAQTASTGPLKGGDIGGSTFSFGGINTGTTGSALSPWMYGIGVGLIVLGLLVYALKK